MNATHEGMRRSVATLAHWTRRTRDFAISTASVVMLAGDVLFGRTRQIWVGDSHSVCFNRGFATANVLRAGRGVYVVHVGARLMYSIARKGLPLWSTRLVKVVGACSRRPPALLACFGEIDVRCHLAKPETNADPQLAFVADYAQVIAAIADSQFSPIAFVAPPPPCRDHLNLHEYPVIGTFDERRRAFDRLRERLRDCAQDAGVPAIVIDATPVLGDAESGMSSELTDDRCHANLAGAQLVRELVRQQLQPAS